MKTVTEETKIEMLNNLNAIAKEYGFSYSMYEVILDDIKDGKYETAEELVSCILPVCKNRDAKVKTFVNGFIDRFHEDGQAIKDKANSILNSKPMSRKRKILFGLGVFTTALGVVPFVVGNKTIVGLTVGGFIAGSGISIAAQAAKGDDTESSKG